MNTNPSLRAALTGIARCLGFAERPAASSRQQLGQVLPIFAIMAVVLLGGAALITDVAWWWTNEQRMQRAADAAALAGAVYLPGDEARAFSAARAEATKNGYTSGAAGVTVTPRRDPANNRKLIVDVDGPVQTHFARVFCWDGGPCLQRVDVGVTGAAEFVLPVPMGSPENYYGVFGLLRMPEAARTEVTTTTGTTAYRDPSTSVPTSGNWTNPNNAWTRQTTPNPTPPASAATKNSTTNPRQSWGGFGIPAAAPGTGALTANGIQLEIRAASTDASGCDLLVRLTGSGAAVTTNTGWTTERTIDLTNTAYQIYTVGSLTDVWGQSWNETQLSDANFRVRLEYAAPGGCSSGATISVEHVAVRVAWTRTTTIIHPEVNVAGPNGEVLNPHGFWGGMLTKGGDTQYGDAYLARCRAATTCGSQQNPTYDPANYYNYAIEFPEGSSNGQLQIFDPGFCAVKSTPTDVANPEYGTGDKFMAGTQPNPRPGVPIYYLLYDTRETPYNLADDTLVWSSGSFFAPTQGYTDPTLEGPATGGAAALQNCSWAAIGNNPSHHQYYHNRWYPVPVTLDGGKTYRLHTTTTDPQNPNAHSNVNAYNSFSLWSRATGGTPRIYGIGAMEAYAPLTPGATAEFFLAQIEAEHAGKTVEIRLWDPGDTQRQAELRIRIPTTSGYVNANFDYSAGPGPGARCGTSGSGSSVETNSGGPNNNLFNGCWLTMLIAIPPDYDAPLAGNAEPGWWKIRYTVSATGTQAPTDLTTWEVTIRGNPVHLVPE